MLDLGTDSQKIQRTEKHVKPTPTGMQSAKF